MSFCVAGAALGAPPERSAEVWRRLITMGAGCFCVAGAALGAPQSHFAWQLQHSEHLSDIFAWQVQHSEHLQRSAKVRRRLGTMGAGCFCVAWRTSVSFCVAGATLRASQCHFAWQVQQSEHLHLHITTYTTSSTQHHLHRILNTTPSTPHHQTQHHQHTHTPFTLHHQHNLHQHITIYITPSTQHHLHIIFHTTPSTPHHHILAGAALGALPSYPFCLIPADTPLVILRCGFFFVPFC